MIERGKMYPIEEFGRLLKEDMAASGFMDPHSLIMAARAKQSEFAEALSPVEVIFDYQWPREQDAPSLGVGLAHGDIGNRRYHAVIVPQRPPSNAVDDALAYVRQHAAELKAKVGAA